LLKHTVSRLRADPQSCHVPPTARSLFDLKTRSHASPLWRKVPRISSAAGDAARSGNYVNPAGRPSPYLLLVANSRIVRLFTTLQSKSHRDHSATLQGIPNRNSATGFDQSASRSSVRRDKVRRPAGARRSNQGRSPGAIPPFARTARDDGILVSVKAGRAGADRRCGRRKEEPYFREVWTRNHLQTR